MVGSRDDMDPDHPLAVAEAYVERIPGALLAVEQADATPLAWRGSALSSLVAEHLGAGGRTG